MTSVLATSDEQFMKRALKQAKLGLGLTSPNPPVGAVIVSSKGKVLGSGFHHRAGEAHAEIMAIHNALKKHPSRALKKSTIYITLEPCSTTGQTPPCTQAIIDYGFSRVVYACSDPNPSHKGRAKRLLKRKGIEVISGVLEKDCQLLIRYFTKVIKKGLPWVIAKSAMTLDGRTTLPPGRGSWISSKESLADVQVLRGQIDAILIGGATLREDNPRLTLRGPYTDNNRPQPWRIITSLSGNLPASSRVFTDQYRDRTKVFKKQSLKQVLKKLANMDIHSVMIESGGKLLGNALKNDLVDELVFYYAPIVGGGPTHAIQMDNLSQALINVETKRIGPDIRIRGLINHS